MTDEEEFRKLFAKFGIEWEQPEPTSRGSCYEIQPGETPNVFGYNGFITTFYFDYEGKFNSINIWE